MLVANGLQFNRLAKCSRRNVSLSCSLCFKCLGSALKNVLDKRNIGIIAHIDAGKTTVTERLLYLSGLTTIVGDVDDGNTITDFMDLERERGITIQSAAITSTWRNYQINIIDTPGHVDFTLEVERALRVMDGIVTILDGSAGVQAQTLTVWRQASKFKLPSVFFVNKLDKPTFDFWRSIDSVEQRLSHSVVPIVVPVMKQKELVGILDLFKKTILNTQNLGKTTVWTPIKNNKKYEDLHAKHWESLLSKLGEVDEDFEEKLLSTDNIPAIEVEKMLRHATISSKISPIVCGSALKNTESVCSILDMIVDYLPGPSERHYNVPSGVESCALVFKIGHDTRYGQLSYARVYKGQIKEGQDLLNANNNTKENNFKLFISYSDVLHPAEYGAKAGDIIVFSGLKTTVTGNTLVGGLNLKKTSVIESRKFVLEGIELPNPVFSCSIEPPSTSTTALFEKALAQLVVEDPSLKTRKDQETNQTILEGMGELHIEVMKERLKREYGLNVFMGRLRVGYQEILNKSILHSSYTEDLFGDAQQKHWCSMRLQLNSTKSFSNFEKILVDIDDEEESPLICKDWIKVINEGCKVALYNGPLLGFPVNNLSISLKAFSTSGRRINVALLSACASRCVKEALKNAGTCLIEPVMKAELTLLADSQGNLYLESVLRELSRRRAEIDDIDEDMNGHFITIHAKLPLSETTGIANKIRILTSGLCNLHMQFFKYEKVLPEEQSLIVKRHLRGEI